MLSVSISKPANAPQQKAKLSPDWVMSIESNVHGCNDRGWFSSYTPFQATVHEALTLSAPGMVVLGIGTVNLPVRRSPNKTGPLAHGTLRLTNVLHIPSLLVNIVGQPLLSDCPIWSFGTPNPAKSKGAIYDAKRKRLAYFTPHSPLYALRLSGPPIGPKLTQSALSADAPYVIRLLWIDSERRRWEAHQTKINTTPAARNKPALAYVEKQASKTENQVAPVSKAKVVPLAGGKPALVATKKPAPVVSSSKPVPVAANKPAPVAASSKPVPVAANKTALEAASRKLVPVAAQKSAPETASSKPILVAAKKLAPVAASSKPIPVTPRKTAPLAGSSKPISVAGEKTAPVAATSKPISELATAACIKPAQPSWTAQEIVPAYTAKEKDWLKRHHGGEFRFLRRFGLKIYDEDDREEGRLIARDMMSQNTCKESENEVDEKSTQDLQEDDSSSTSSEEEEDEEEEEIDEEEEYEDSSEGSLEEYIADHWFSDEELVFIRKHWGDAEIFMACHDLKFYKPKDCEVAALILQEIMKV